MGPEQDSVIKLEGHTNWVSNVLSLGLNKLVSASYDNTLKIWNLLTGKEEKTLMGHKTFIENLYIFNNLALIASVDR